MSENYLYDSLSSMVDIKLTNHENIEKLTSDSDLGTIHAQIKYFNVFLITSIEEDNPETIFNILPWMYHAFNSQGFSYDYFLLLYDIWEVCIENILDEQSKKKFHLTLQQLKQTHTELINQSEHYSTVSIEIPKEYQQLKEEFMQSLLHGDQNKAKSLFKNSVNTPAELQVFYKYIIYPAMCDVGIAWQKGLITPAHEHLATTILLNILSRVYETTPIPEVDKKEIIVATTTNEYHEVGALMLTSAFQLHGWDVEYFGTAATEDELVSAVKEKKPFILALSVSMPFNIKPTKKLIERIREFDKDLKIMVGGNAFNSKTLSKNKCGADIYLKDIDDALNEAALWLEAENDSL